MAEVLTELPRHLARYVVDQDYSRYTPEDQAVWRHILKQLVRFLSVHAHPCYRDGLERTGITLDRIPRIEVMSEHLMRYGWRAVAVSGFIPPAAFMELQSLGVLPIACDIRSKDHLLYTPAPDIVHEAAGHAPILIDPVFANYLKRYANVAKKAIVTRKDIEQYDAIRVLSDLKEDPRSTDELIRAAEARLSEATRSITEPSEAALLGRMNWWTAEYGLIGTLEDPLIFGAGLLSSVGESRHCLDASVRKIPFSIDCIDYSYDITEPQPQLFVVREFGDLHDVLDSFQARLAFTLGGLEGLTRALASETVNTVELDTGLQISGTLKEIFIGQSPGAKGPNGSEQVRYLVFKGPTQLSLQNHQIHGQGPDHHTEGYSTAIGPVRWAYTAHLGERAEFSSWLSSQEFNQLRLERGREISLEFQRGIRVTGYIESESQFIKTLRGARVQDLRDPSRQPLFLPEWGLYDLAIGSDVVSVFGGPADRSLYPDSIDFAKRTVTRHTPTQNEMDRLELYRKVQRNAELTTEPMAAAKELLQIIPEVLNRRDWLLTIEVLNGVERAGAQIADPKVGSELSAATSELMGQLKAIGMLDDAVRAHIEDALNE